MHIGRGSQRYQFLFQLYFYEQLHNRPNSEPLSCFLPRQLAFGVSGHFRHFRHSRHQKFAYYPASGMVIFSTLRILCNPPRIFHNTLRHRNMHCLPRSHSPHVGEEAASWDGGHQPQRIRTTWEAGTEVVATAATPSMVTTTRRSRASRSLTNRPSTPAKGPPMMRTRSPFANSGSWGER